MSSIGITNWMFLIVSLLGIILIVMSVINRKRASASQSWMGAQGKVTESFVHESTSTDSDGHTSTDYKPKVHYIYSVNGREYECNRINFGGGSTSRAKAQSVIAQYPIESSVIVYYDPQNPKQAVLERTTQGGWLQIIVGVILIITGIYFSMN